MRNAPRKERERSGTRFEAVLANLQSELPFDDVHRLISMVMNVGRGSSDGMKQCLDDGKAWTDLVRARFECEPISPYPPLFDTLVRS